MPKISAWYNWLIPYPEMIVAGDQIICMACNKKVTSDKKFLVDQHARTASHIAKSQKMRTELKQPSLKERLESIKIPLLQENDGGAESEYTSDLGRPIKIEQENDNSSGEIQKLRSIKIEVEMNEIDFGPSGNDEETGGGINSDNREADTTRGVSAPRRNQFDAMDKYHAFESFCT